MPFDILRDDITDMKKKVDAIVNTANPYPIFGSGVDRALHQKAGPELLAARRRIGQIQRGHCAITPAYRLNAKYVIHTVGPRWDGGSSGEEQLLRQCYDNSLHLAWENGCRSIAFPSISTGNYGFPKETALRIAIKAFEDFLENHEMDIYLVVFTKESVRLSGELFRPIESFINENYVKAKEREEYGYERLDTEIDLSRFEQYLRRDRRPRLPRREPRDDAREMLPLAQQLAQPARGWSQQLLKLIDASGKKDSDIYKKANITRQHFSSIRNDPEYRPTKQTAIAFAIALRLSYEETQEFIGYAGYTLTRSSKADIIVEYYIRAKNYSIIELNIALYDYGQKMLNER